MSLFMRLSSRLPARSVLPYLALAAGALALSFAAMFVRWAQAPGVVTGFYRLLLSTAILLPFLIFRGSGNKPCLNWSCIWYAILSGMCMAVNLALWNTSLSYTTVANASILGNTTPLWVCLAAWWLLRERLNWRFWLGLLAMFVGVVLIMSGGSVLHPQVGLGDSLAFSASFFSAAYLLIMQRGRRHLDALTYVWINGASAAVWMLVIAVILNYPLAGFSGQTWIVFICAAIITQIIGYMAISYALGSLPASIVSPSLNLQPVLTILLAIPLLQELPTSIETVGCLLALAGVYLINHSYQQRLTSASPVT